LKEALTRETVERRRI